MASPYRTIFMRKENISYFMQWVFMFVTRNLWFQWLMLLLWSPHYKPHSPYWGFTLNELICASAQAWGFNMLLADYKGHLYICYLGFFHRSHVKSVFIFCQLTGLVMNSMNQNLAKMIWNLLWKRKISRKKWKKVCISYKNKT